MAKRSHGTPHRPSMFEVAQMAGVSHQTVSRVINDSPDVSDATRTKVQYAIRTLGYRPSNSARALASSRSRTIGLIAGGMRFFGPISAMASIESLARAHGMFMAVSLVYEPDCSQEEFDELCATFDEQNVDAFVFLAPTDAMFAAASRVKTAQPRVLVTSTHGRLSMREALSNIPVSDRRHSAVVGIDQWGAMAQVAQLVAGFGHRDALYFAGPPDWRDASTRRNAWKYHARAAYIRSTTIQCLTWEATEAYARMNHVLESLGSSGASIPSVVVTANDNQAVGVARALHEHNLRIGQDVSLIGFDDMPSMDNLYPPLTTVRADFEQLGTAAMREVLYLLHEGAQPTFAVTQHGVGLIPATVIKRSSLGAVSSC